jgi:hypothetical protein
MNRHSIRGRVAASLAEDSDIRLSIRLYYDVNLRTFSVVFDLGPYTTGSLEY